MTLHLKRFYDGPDETPGILYIPGTFPTFIVEDEKQAVKVPGETRIPAGRYRLALRTEGTHHERYAKKFPGMHKGMIHLLDVPNFLWILYHIGNMTSHTDGCLLAGLGIHYDTQGRVRTLDSEVAYVRTYPMIASAIEKEDTYIVITDPDQFIPVVGKTVDRPLSVA